MLVTVCDKCQKIISDLTDEVVIEYRFVKSPALPIKSHERVTLCADCYRELFGDQFDEIKEGKKIW